MQLLRGVCGLSLAMPNGFSKKERKLKDRIEEQKAALYPDQLLRGVIGLSLATLNLPRADETGAYCSTTTCSSMMHKHAVRFANAACNRYLR